MICLERRSTDTLLESIQRPISVAYWLLQLNQVLSHRFIVVAIFAAVSEGWVGARCGRNIEPTHVPVVVDRIERTRATVRIKTEQTPFGHIHKCIVEDVVVCASLGAWLQIKVPNSAKLILTDVCASLCV